MSSSSRLPATRWTRAEAISHLRRALRDLCAGERSMCQVAAEQGIFCRGFRRWPEKEFHERWKSLIGVSTHLNRDQMEELADIWQLSEQLRHGAALVCDAQTLFPGACRGWDEFSNEDLARFCGEILNQEAAVSDERLETPEPSTYGGSNELDTDWTPGDTIKSAITVTHRRSTP